MHITVSAPGKTILMGEHAAVYGRPALVAAVDRRLYARLSETATAGVRLELPEIGISTTVAWEAIHDYGRSARARWRAYRQHPGPETFRRLRGDDPAHLVKVALDAAATVAGRNCPVDRQPLGVELRLRSEIPIGAGFGSSAAVAVAIAYGYLRLCGADVSDLERVGLEIERRQHGSPSGIDTATVIRGGLVWAAKGRDRRLVTTPVAARAADLERIRVYNSGTPTESTGAVVAAVRARRDADGPGFERLLERMEAATRELRRQLESGPGAGEAPGSGRLVEPMREFEACLEEAGVVPPRLREIIRAVEARGGAAKISGAGALSGTGAGSLLVCPSPAAEVEMGDGFDGLERLDVRLGAEGVRVEV